MYKLNPVLVTALTLVLFPEGLEEFSVTLIENAEFGNWTGNVTAVGEALGTT